MNNLNKNKPIFKTKNKGDIDNDLLTINKDNINIITSRSNLKVKTLATKTNNKNNAKQQKPNSKITSKKSINANNKQQRVTVNNYNDNIEFPQGEKYKCIGPCYPANIVYYHPLTLQAIKSKSNSCPIRQTKEGVRFKIKDKCVLNENYDYEQYDMFADVIQVATSDNTFLEQIYNIKNIYDAELFLENNITQLPTLSQKRILNSIYKVYRDNDSFPSNNFVSLVKNLLKKNYDAQIKSKKIISKIMDNKHGIKWHNLFNGLLE